MNLDELERLHRKAVGGDWRNLPSNMLNEIWEAFPALLALARDGERYRWLRDPCSGAEKVVLYGRGDFGKGLASGTMLDAAIDAARKGERNGNS